MEYRYWGFIEGHPAHTSLPTETQTEAMDALKWSYTGTHSPIEVSPIPSLIPS